MYKPKHQRQHNTTLDFRGFTSAPFLLQHHTPITLNSLPYHETFLSVQCPTRRWTVLWKNMLRSFFSLLTIQARCLRTTQAPLNVDSLATRYVHGASYIVTPNGSFALLLVRTAGSPKQQTIRAQGGRNKTQPKHANTNANCPSSFLTRPLPVSP